MALGVLLFVAVFGTATVYGATFEGGEEFALPERETVRDDLYVGAGVATLSGNVIGDLLIAGGEVTVLGEVSGNLIGAGGNVTVSGGVGRDALVAGGDVNILGFVRDDLRVVGGNVQVANAVGGDVVAAGGVVHLVSGATVSGDVVVFGGLTTIDGTVTGDVRVEGGELRINGTILGSLDAKVQDGLMIGDGANIGGGVYESAKEAEIDEGATVRGELTFEEVTRSDAPPTGEKILGFGVTTMALMLLVVALILVYAAKDGTRSVVSHVARSFWKSVGVGFVALIILPILAFILLITLIGMPLGFLLGLGYMTVLLAAKLATSVVIGALAIKLATRSDDIRLDWVTAIVGVVVLLALMLIPVIGFLASFILFLATFGSVLHLLKNRLWS